MFLVNGIVVIVDLTSFGLVTIVFSTWLKVTGFSDFSLTVTPGWKYNTEPTIIPKPTCPITLKIPFNVNNSLLFFGEITNTPYGRFPLYPKTSKDNNKPLSNNEHRFVKKKKYRE